MRLFVHSKRKANNIALAVFGPRAAAAAGGRRAVVLEKISAPSYHRSESLQVSPHLLHWANAESSPALVRKQ